MRQSSPTDMNIVRTGIVVPFVINLPDGYLLYPISHTITHPTCYPLLPAYKYSLTSSYVHTLPNPSLIHHSLNDDTMHPGCRFTITPVAVSLLRARLAIDKHSTKVPRFAAHQRDEWSSLLSQSLYTPSRRASSLHWLVCWLVGIVGTMDPLRICVRIRTSTKHKCLYITESQP